MWRSATRGLSAPLSSYDGRIAARVKVDRKGIAARPIAVGDVLYVYGKGGKLAAYTLPGA